MAREKRKDYVWYVHSENNDTNASISDALPGETSYPRECFDYDYKKKRQKRESCEKHLWECKFHLVEHLLQEKNKDYKFKIYSQEGRSGKIREVTHLFKKNKGINKKPPKKA